jgi:Asp-tRNA(Asn)/Glu-tRNA(Gln) amidotransferase A subunit family amidase
MTDASGFHLSEATIQSAQDALTAGQVTSRDLVQGYLDRIAAYDKQGPTLNSVQTINPRALEQAERLDAQRRSSGPVGALYGIPVAVKDQVETDDMPTTYGSALFRDFVSERNATVVEKLKAAGAIIVAKTTMGEFAQGYAGSAFGACRNPYDPTRNPSGSSAGSGVAVAANLAMVAVGEDTLGSVRGPAARTSLVGLRPTTPLVSRFGMMPAAPSRDTLGPMARTVRDAAALLDVLAGYDPNDPMTAACVGHVPATYTSYCVAEGLRGMRLGMIRDPMVTDANPGSDEYRRVHAVIDVALRDLAASGAEIVDPVTIPSLLDLLERTNGTFESEAATNEYLAALAEAPVKTLQEIVLSPEVLLSRRVRLLEGVGRTTSDPGHLQHLLARDALRQAILKAMADHHLDALVYSTFDSEAALIPDDILTAREVLNLGNNRRLAPMIGFPALTVPAGFTQGNLPVGIEFLGRPFTEGTLFTIGNGYEQSTHHRRPPSTAPPLPGEI